jgi:hypothetical protein
VAVLLAMGVVFLGGGGLAAYWFIFKKAEGQEAKQSSSSSPGTAASSSEDVAAPYPLQELLGKHARYVPDNPAAISRFNLERIRANALYKDLVRVNPPAINIPRNVAANFGILERDIDQMTTVALGGNKALIIFSCKSNADMGRAIGMRGLEARRVAGFDVYDDKAHTISLVVPESGVGLQGSPTTVDSVLQRRGKAELARLQLAKEVVSASECSFAMMDPGFITKGAPPWMKSALGVGATYDIGAFIAETSVVLYEDEATAQANRDGIEDYTKKDHATPDSGSFEVTVSGSKVVIVERWTADQARKLGKKALDGFVVK